MDRNRRDACSRDQRSDLPDHVALQLVFRRGRLTDRSIERNGRPWSKQENVLRWLEGSFPSYGLRASPREVYRANCQQTGAHFARPRTMTGRLRCDDFPLPYVRRSFSLHSHVPKSRRNPTRANPSPWWSRLRPEDRAMCCPGFSDGIWVTGSESRSSSKTDRAREATLLRKWSAVRRPTATPS